MVFAKQTNILGFSEQSQFQRLSLTVPAVLSLVEPLSWLGLQETAILSTAHPVFAYCIHWFYHSILFGHFIECNYKFSKSPWWASGSKNGPNLKPHKPLSVF